MNNTDLDKNEIYILNPAYNIKSDKNKVIIFNRINDPRYNTFTGSVHPIYAIILSLFDGNKKLSEVETRIASLLKQDIAAVANILHPLLENSEEINFHYDGYRFSFPVRLLVKKQEKDVVYPLDSKTFYIPKKDLDMTSWRLNSPLDLLYIINTRCLTDCVYCYADRQKQINGEVTFQRLKQLIAEARKLEMRSFDINGGEFFLYQRWPELLAELLSHGFSPFISTKIPLDLPTIQKMKEIGLNRVQISLDSVISGELKKMWKVPGHYLDRLKESFKNLDENGFEIFTNTQITAFNQDNIKQLFDYLLTLKNLKRMNVGAAGFTLYKGSNEYKDYKPTLTKIKEIEDRVNELKEKYKDKVSINFSGYIEGTKLNVSNPDEKKEKFNKRARCSGNFYAFVLLPDGKVTVCEELYWHPHFIIGDLNKQSIEEVWNSEKVLELFNISKAAIREESKCKTCAEFDSCHRFKGLCWKEILYAYGHENWDYPDPKCPYAPPSFREYYL